VVGGSWTWFGHSKQATKKHEKWLCGTWLGLSHPTLHSRTLLLLDNACSHGPSIHPCSVPCHGPWDHVEGCGWAEGRCRCSRAGASARSTPTCTAGCHSREAMGRGSCCACASCRVRREMVYRAARPEVFDQSWRACSAQLRVAVDGGSSSGRLAARDSALGCLRAPCARATGHLCTALHGGGGLNLVPVVGPFAVMMLQRGWDGSEIMMVWRQGSCVWPLKKISSHGLLAC